jgi:hypothetical protein
MVNIKMNEMPGRFTEAAKNSRHERFYQPARNPISPTPASFCTLHSKLCPYPFLDDPRCSLLILDNPR